MQPSYFPLYKQFISEIEKGFSLLDETSKLELINFVKTQQHGTGAFPDRAGRPDLYYSLFGAWMAEALHLKPQKEKLKRFILEINPEKRKKIDRFAILLIRIIFQEKELDKPSVFSFSKFVLDGKPSINPAYQAFLFLLTFDALYGKNKSLYFILKALLTFYRVPEGVPSGFVAALLVAKYLAGMNVEKEKAELLSYFEEGKGFTVFKETKSADLLSTAVALFALKKAGADLRLVAPDAFQLVQQNYADGAFLSGDGDLTRDLEYTFYGLLTLGTLS
ncbi:hypothetical protein SAMN05444280_12164 [Tangfeifania diversioriginum]|uniref:Prenyltransferase and squalene oxidase repeat-containing protein n=1 Tax=Tangfeifania diversioriginum TaxID=1168035 RepID=A0A1M6JX31_9BACT|nr:hypothetical protein [Tangfeifania diversioriginum]SHJ51230.1 hypothetical protein SAMN05444280_12164 [Tangfeifania diversioriginum]